MVLCGMIQPSDHICENILKKTANIQINPLGKSFKHYLDHSSIPFQCSIPPFHSTDSRHPDALLQGRSRGRAKLSLYWISEAGSLGGCSPQKLQSVLFC